MIQYILLAVFLPVSFVLGMLVYRKGMRDNKALEEKKEVKNIVEEVFDGVKKPKDIPDNEDIFKAIDEYGETLK